MSADTQPSSILTITSTSRPKRVAFLVDGANVSVGDIDGIINYSSTLWGGRFHPIIPTNGAEIATDWWRTLEAADPDVVVSLLPLSDQLVAKINRSILPLSISESSREERQRFGRDKIDFGDVEALSTRDIPRQLWSKRSALREPTFYYLRSVRGDPQLEQFVLRNFGLQSSDLFTAQMFQDIQHRTFDIQSLQLRSFFEGEFSPRSTHPIFPIDLSAQYAALPYSLDHRQQSQASGFHLVVGDSPWDSIYSWNLALQGSSIGGRNSLWLPESALADEELIALIGDWTQRMYWGENQHRRGILVSYSVPEEKLARFVPSLSTHSRMPFKTRNLQAEEHPFPRSFDSVGRQRNRSLFSQREEPKTEHVSLSGDHALVSYEKPSFLERSEQRSGWMVDLEIEYRPEKAVSNVRPVWRLPKRLGVPYQFVEQGGNSGRVTYEGLPSFAVASDDQRLAIKIPSDRSVLWASCFQGFYSNVRKKHSYPPSMFEDLETSDKGLYLRGVLQIFGSVFHAARFFGDPFWRCIAYSLSSWDAPEEFERKRIDLTSEALSDALRGIGAPLTEGDGNIEKVAEAIARKLTFRDNEDRAMTLKQIKGCFNSQRGKELKESRNKGYWNAHRSFDAWRESEFNDLLHQNVIIQGLALQCPHCNTAQWRKIDDLKPVIECEGCTAAFDVPANPEWSFRINSLIGNAIKYHGTVPVLMALHTIQHEILLFGSMVFLPCQDLILRKDKKSQRRHGEADFVFRRGSLVTKSEAFTDLDLIFLANGDFAIGEVKSTVSGFKPEDFEKLKTVALDLLPDKLVLAAFGTAWPDDIAISINSLTSELSEVDVEVMSLFLRWD